MRSRILSFGAFAIGFLVLYCCSPVPQVRNMKVYDGYAQGTTFHIVYDSVAGNLNEKIDSIFRVIDASMSLYDSSSLICKFNKSESGLMVDEHFYQVFSLSKNIHQITDGAFNPAVYPLVKLWGFGPNRFHEDSVKNKDSKADSLLQFTHFEDIEFDSSKSNPSQNQYFIAKKKRKNMLDFNGIAQGYTVDVISELFENKGIANYMIEVGGEVKAKGINVQGKTWRIGIDKPVEETDKRVLQAIVNLENLALATSGSYRKFYIKDGKRYSHTIDPFTGKPVKHNLLSVSVFTSSCARADGLATAFMAMGSQKAVDFIRKNTDVQIYMISSGAANDYQIYMSPGMDKFIESVQQQ